MSSTQAPPKKKKRFGCLRIVVLTVLVVITLVVGAVGIGFWLWRTPPATAQHYEQFIASHDAETLDRMADSAWNRAWAQYSSIGQADPWDETPAQGTSPDATPPADGASPSASATNSAIAGDPNVRTIRVTVDEANAWMARRLDQWAANQGKSIPPMVNDIAVGVSGSDVVLSAHLVTDQFDQWFSASVRPTLRADGSLTLELISARAGRLPVPMDRLIEQVQDRLGGAGSDSMKMVDLLRTGLPLEPVLEIDRTRQARLIGLDLSDDGISATIKSEPIGTTAEPSSE